MRKYIQRIPLWVAKKIGASRRKQAKDENSVFSVGQSAFFSFTDVSGVGENGSPPADPTETSPSTVVGGARLRSHSLINVDAVRFRLPGLNFVSAGQGISSLFLLKIDDVADFGVNH